MSEIPVVGLISVAEAIRIIDSVNVTPGTERIALADSMNRRLAEAIVADRDDPPFDKSQMDGFAVRADDSLRLIVVGDVPAGAIGEGRIAPGQAMSIMTGAPVPSGADAVVPVEKTSRENEVVVLAERVKLGQSIARRGSDCRDGDEVLRSGTILGPAQLAVAASVGAAQVQVFARPRVAVLSTGDEIVPIDTPPQTNQIRNTNHPLLTALLTTFGCDVGDMGIVRDDPAALRQQLEIGVASFDALFVTGGMSMGTYDYVPRLLVEMGFELRVSKLRIKPGKPFVFATRGKQIVFGLPGNPVSGFVCTLRLASRLLTRMGGGLPEEQWILGKLATGLPANGPREFYQPVVVERQGGPVTSARSEFPTIRPLPWKASSDIYTLAAANALLIRAENEPPLPQGTPLNVLLLPH